MTRLFSARSLSRVFALGAYFASSAAQAGVDPGFSVLNIPASLSKNAYSIVREERVEYRIISTRETVRKTHRVITILDPRAKGQSVMRAYYDKDSKITDIDGTLYNSMGTVVRNVKNRDIHDLSATSSNNIMDDNRVKMHDFEYMQYPFTVEYNIETHYNTNFFIPAWFPINNYHQAIQNSEFRVSAPAELMPLWKAFNFQAKPVSVTEKDFNTLTWKLIQYPALDDFFAAPLFTDLAPHIRLASQKFQLHGYDGTSESWNSLGKFFLTLNKGRDELPAETVAKVNELIKGVTDPREKVRILYQFMQAHTHYISIQLGIGGLQPFPAAEVAKKGYGDCKALSNYMVSLLKVAGVPALYTLVQAGTDDDDRDLEESLPSSQFNHIIVCVPMNKDSLWLECTSQDDQAGYMGAFTGNRKGLAITEDGGKLISTPRYGIAENTLSRKGYAVINAEGTLNLKIESEYNGMKGDALHGVLHQGSGDDLKTYIRSGITLSSFMVDSIQIKELQGASQTIKQSFNIHAENSYNMNAKRVFITPLVMDRVSFTSTIDSSRTQDFVFSKTHSEEQEYVYEIPVGYKLEFAPKGLEYNAPMGSYKASVEVVGNKLVYRRSYVAKAARVPASKYSEVEKFFSSIARADKTNLVLVKSEN